MTHRHTPNAGTRVSNTVANARTRMFGPARKQNRIVKRGGNGWAAAEARCR